MGFTFGMHYMVSDLFIEVGQIGQHEWQSITANHTPLSAQLDVYRTCGRTNGCRSKLSKSVVVLLPSPLFPELKAHYHEPRARYIFSGYEGAKNSYMHSMIAIFFLWEAEDFKTCRPPKRAQGRLPPTGTTWLTSKSVYAMSLIRDLSDVIGGQYKLIWC